MLDETARSPLQTSRRSIRFAVTSPIRAQTYRNLLYLLLAFPLGIAYFVILVTGLSVGASLVILLVGVPILGVVVILGHGLAWFERKFTTYLLGVDVPEPEYRFLDESERPLRRVVSLFVGLETWKMLVYLLSKFFIGVAAFVAITTALALSLAFLLTPLYYDRPGGTVGIQVGEPIALTPSIQIPWGDLLIGAELALTITDWEVTTLPEALALSALGGVTLLVSLAALNAFAWLIGQYTRLALGDWNPFVDRQTT